MRFYRAKRLYSSADCQSGYSVHRYQHDPARTQYLVLDQLAAAAIYKDVQPVLVVTKSDLAAADMLRTAYTGSGSRWCS